MKVLPSKLCGGTGLERRSSCRPLGRRPSVAGLYPSGYPGVNFGRHPGHGSRPQLHGAGKVAGLHFCINGAAAIARAPLNSRKPQQAGRMRGGGTVGRSSWCGAVGTRHWAVSVDKVAAHPPEPQVNSWSPHRRICPRLPLGLRSPGIYGCRLPFSVLSLQPTDRIRGRLRDCPRMRISDSRSRL